MLRKIKHLLSKKRGFTLIELVVVIAILAILAAVLVPTYSSYITQAKDQVEGTNAKAAYNNANIYAAQAVQQGSSGTLAGTDWTSAVAQYSPIASDATVSAIVSDDNVVAVMYTDGNGTGYYPSTASALFPHQTQSRTNSSGGTPPAQSDTVTSGRR